MEQELLARIKMSQQQEEMAFRNQIRIVTLASDGHEGDLAA